VSRARVIRLKAPCWSLAWARFPAGYPLPPFPAHWHRSRSRASGGQLGWTSPAQIIAGCGLEKHMAIVGYLKSEHGMGHGHANALVGWTRAGNVASP
jgi:hypothetical protein